MPDNHAILSDMTSTETKPASEKQLALIVKLAAERSFDLSEFNLDTLTGGREGTASKIITSLFAMERPATAGTTPAKSAPAEGFYHVKTSQDQVDVVRVQLSKSGNWYAKLAVKPRNASRKTLDWDYLGKRIDMRNAVPMTPAEAGRFLSYCVLCGKELTVLESIERGMGPVCAAK